MTLRPARPGDLDSIRHILNAEIRGGTASWTMTEKTAADMAVWFEARQSASLPVIVAESRGEVAGYASFGPFRQGEGYRHTVEHSVYVAAHARRRGIARRLLSGLIAEARARGLRRMVGGVSADQAASLALHHALGFEEQGRLRGVGVKHGRALDLCLMVLDLDASA